jgi:hypothetical protein
LPELPVADARLLSGAGLLPGPIAAGSATLGKPIAETAFDVIVVEVLVPLEPGWPDVPENGPPPATPLVPPIAMQPEMAQATTVAPPEL